jgi:predicted transcriptional regulator
MPSVSAWVSDETYDRVKKLADKKSTTPSKIIKSAIENIQIKDQSLELEKLNALSRIGNNLNQIARLANQKKSVDIQVLQELVKIEKMMNELIDAG